MEGVEPIVDRRPGLEPTPLLRALLKEILLPPVDASSFRTGLEVALESPPPLLRGASFALLANHASVDRRLRSAPERLAEAFPGRLRAIFSPQHGFWGTEQDDMIETRHGRHPRLGVPLWSLYSSVREPQARMLEGVEVLVVDLQDAGTRVYTFAATLLACLRAGSRLSIPVLVLDRPDPLGGVVVEGPRLEEGQESLVGAGPIPMRHGLTFGELARWLARRLCERGGPEVRLEVVAMRGWRRADGFAGTERAWIAPSPNLPRLESVALYPGTVLLEGTNLSEGRGTTLPFEVVGAPFVDPWRLRDELPPEALEGCVARPVRFRPVFQKWSGRECGGLAFTVVDSARFRPWRLGAWLLAAARRLWPREYAWKEPPYEYETERMPIDLIAGGPRLREAVDAGLDGAALERVVALDAEAWWAEVEELLLYPREEP